MPNRRLRTYAAALSALLGLFVLRVLAQALIAIGHGAFLPPWKEWFSGVVPYPQLLASQIAIILGYGKVCLDRTPASRLRPRERSSRRLTPCIMAGGRRPGLCCQ